MSVRSVRAYLVNQLDGLSVPTITAGNIRALGYPYAFEAFAVPTVYVWPLQISEQRVGAPRAGSALGGVGPRERLHLFAIGACWTFNPAVSGIDEAQFDDLVGVLDEKFYTIPIPCALTDPVSGETSTLMAVAEGQGQHGLVDWTYRPPTRLDSEGTFLYVAVAKLPAWEWVQA